MKVEMTKAQAVQVVVFLKMLRPELNEGGKQEIDDLVGALNPQIKEINRIDNMMEKTSKFIHDNIL